MKVNINPYKLRFVIIAVLIMAFSGRLYAQRFTYGKFYFSVIEPGKTCSVIGTTNNAQINLKIPATANYDGKELSVTEIGQSAFYQCGNLIGSLTIPESVTKIGERAFYQCSGFTGSLTIPGSVTSIGHSAFEGCSGFTGSLTISEGVTEIGQSAFLYCSGFTGSLTIPEGVTKINWRAFGGCGGFTGSLTIPEGVTSIAYCLASGNITEDKRDR